MAQESSQPIKHFRLALLGFGNVGQAFAELLQAKQEELRKEHHLTFQIVGIATGSHGRAVDPGGLDISRVFDHLQKGGRLDALSSTSISSSPDFIHRVPADVLFETTPVNYQTGQPALDYLKAGLEADMHVITANKGPVVHGYQLLSELAEERRRGLFFESAVMDGAPIFSLFRDALPGAKLLGFRGILNSTTNLILERMDEGESFEDAVAYTQRVGLAETDPSGDVDGWDAAVKVAALATVLMGIPLTPAEVDRTGIRGLSHKDIQDAKAEDKRWKLICSAQLENERLVAEVAPRKVSPDSPFFHVRGSSSAIQFESDVLGHFTLVEENPTPQTTAYGLLADFLHAVQG
jgi:homoserine dehydrogenase